MNRRWTDQDLYKEVLSRFANKTGQRRFVAVDTEEFNRGDSTSGATQSMRELGFPDENSFFRAALVEGNCLGMHLWTMSPKVRDWGIEPINWNSIKRDDVIGAIASFPTAEKFHEAHPFWSWDLAERFARFATTANISDYVIPKEDCPCQLPSQILESTKTRPEDLAMVVIDAEGSDESILHALLELPGFRPSYLQWEVKSAKFTDSVAKLRKRGYRVGRNAPGSADDLNMIAVLADTA